MNRVIFVLGIFLSFAQRSIVNENYRVMDKETHFSNDIFGLRQARGEIT